jgi:hypothetical protein
MEKVLYRFLKRVLFRGKTNVWLLRLLTLFPRYLKEVYKLLHSSLMMEAVRTSETSVDNHFTRQYNPEDSSEQLLH